MLTFSSFLNTFFTASLSVLTAVIRATSALISSDSSLLSHVNIYSIRFFICSDHSVDVSLYFKI